MTKAEHYAKMRRAKAEKRQALGAVATVECGRVEFTGALFGGRHAVRITARDDQPGIVFVEVDGTLTCAKTPRGLRSLLARRIAGRALP